METWDAIRARRTVRHKGEYGIDGSFKTVPAGVRFGGLAVHAVALLQWAAVSWAKGKRHKAALAGAGGLGIAAHTTLYLYATRAGKFVVWERILDELQLRGDETVL